MKTEKHKLSLGEIFIWILLLIIIVAFIYIFVVNQTEVAPLDFRLEYTESKKLI